VVDPRRGDSLAMPEETACRDGKASCVSIR
jgi:hypothetical protein